MEALIAYFADTSPLEIIAVIAAIAYLLLAAKGSIWCWLFAAVSVVAYIFLTFKAQLYAEFLLQFFYLYMAFYGYRKWVKKIDASGLQIKTLKAKIHLQIVVGGMLATALLGFLLKEYTAAALPYLDGFSTVFAIITTFLVAQRVLENWLYWLVIDLVNVYIYFEKSLLLSSYLYAFYVVVVIFGYLNWYKLYRHQLNSKLQA